MTRPHVRWTMGTMSDKVRSMLFELRRRLEAIYGARLLRIILFGSTARGDADPGSDVDVLVVLTGPVDPSEEISRTSDDIAELSCKHGESICCIFMDEIRFNTRNGPLLRNIRREGVPV